MSDTILQKNLVNLKDEINKLIQTSPYNEVKTFFNSTTGKFLIDVLEINNGAINYTVDALKDEMFFKTMKEYESVVKKASDLGYHIKRKIPAKLKYKIVINDPNNILNGISKIIFKGKSFNLNYNGVNLFQENSYTYNITNNNYEYYNYLVEGELIRDTFTVSQYQSFYTHLMEDQNISNYIDGNNDLDLTLYSKYYGEQSNTTDLNNGEYLNKPGEAWKQIKVFRNGITETDLSTTDGYFAFSSTNYNKSLELMFGNDTFGKKCFGDYIIEYFQTSGDLANLKIQSGTEFDIPINGIEVYDINNKKVNSDIINGLLKLVAISNLDGGKDFESIEEIKINAVKLSSLNNTLITDTDFKFYIKYKYNVNVNIWGDNKESKNRLGESKDMNNNIFFTSADLNYDFEENKNNIKFDILNNKVFNDVYNNKNNIGIFDVVKNCLTNNKKDANCISLSTLYLLGYFKPLMYYYKMGVIYGDNNTSVVSKIIEDIDNKGSLNNASYIYLTGDFLKFNINLFYTGNLIVDNNIIKTEIQNEYSINNNIIQSVNTILTKYDLIYKGVSKEYLSSTLSENISLYDYLHKYTKLRTFEIDMILSITDRINSTFTDSYTNPIKMSSFLQIGTNFIHKFMKYCPANKIIIISMLSYYITKYNSLKSLIINSNNYNLFDIDFIQEDLQNINLIKVS